MRIFNAEQLRRPFPQEPTTKPGSDEGGPSAPNVKRPDSSELIKRMRRIDPDQAKRYRQRSGE